MHGAEPASDPMSGFTKGPWHVERESNSAGFAYRRNTLTPSFKVVAGGALVAYVGVEEADARLIASSPDLLAALKEAMEIIDGIRGLPDDEKCEDLCGNSWCQELGCIPMKLRSATAVIARAEGRQ